MDQDEALNSINSDLIRGHIDTIILKALQNGDRYGYDIIKEIEHKSDGQYVIKQPTLYSCLKRLEVQGFVKSYWGSKSIGGRKKYFTLTDMGRELFIRNKNDWDYSRNIINKLIADDDYSTPDLDEEETKESEELADTTDQVTTQEETPVETSEQEDKPCDNENEEVEEETESEEEFDETEDEAEEELNEVETEDELDDETEDEPEETEDEKEFDEESEEDEDEIGETDNEEEDTFDGIAAASEINDEDEDNSDLINKFYDEQSRESYLSNVENAEYKPPQNDEIDASDYFADINEYEEEDENEVAATEEVEETPPEPVLAPAEPASPTPPPPQIDTNQYKYTLRRTIREEETPKTVFYSYKRDSMDTPLDDSEAVIDKEYRGVINRLIADNIVENKPVFADNGNNIDYANLDYYKQEESAPANAQPENVSEIQEISNKITEDTGEKIDLREHNGKAVKEYNNRHFYYSNQLRLLQYGILYGIMLIEIIVCFYFIEGVHNSFAVTNINLALYIAAVALATILPITAFIMARTDYFKRKRINYSAKHSAIFSVSVTILLCLIVLFLNIYGGVLIGDISIYLSSLIMPMVLSTNVIVNAIVFHCLYTSGKYNIEE